MHNRGGGERERTASGVRRFCSEPAPSRNPSRSQARLDGLDTGVNDQARARDVLIHGASYVSPEFAARHGRIGRSWGCTAVRPQVAGQIIDAIKDGRRSAACSSASAVAQRTRDPRTRDSGFSGRAGAC